MIYLYNNNMIITSRTHQQKMERAKDAIKKLDKFISFLVNIRNDVDTTGIITDEMKILFHYIDEYNEILNDMNDTSYDLSDSSDEYMGNRSSMTDLSENRSLEEINGNESPEYMSDIEIEGNNDIYKKYIDGVIEKSGLEYRNYIGSKLISKKLILKDA